MSGRHERLCLGGGFGETIRLAKQAGDGGA